ncbi:MAG TPA: hypothetical protein PKC43_05690 [Phycisphaerales bacterium]|nr:hypothetical protein [Phycisphaerales bacterium]HMP36924.1 hypothetical protein [Phycisphaerales bacterium]
MPIPDPDAVVHGAAGIVSGMPGSGLVGGIKELRSLGGIRAIRPDQTVVEL